MVGSASAADFKSASQVVTFNPGAETSVTRAIGIVDDNFVEAAEQFRVLLQSRDANSTEIGNIGETTITIVDNLDS